MLGWGEAFKVSAYGCDRFAQLDAAFKGFVSTSNADNPVAFATLTFAPDSAAASVLVVPQLLGRWSNGVLEVWDNCSLSGGSRSSSLGQPATFGPTATVGLTSTPPDPTPAPEFLELELLPGFLTREGYRRAVAAALARLEVGDLKKVVLARDLQAQSFEPLDVFALIGRLQAANPESYTFCVDGMVGASPELLVAVSGKQVRSRVLAGTAPVAGESNTDNSSASWLSASEKNLTEHAFAAQSVIDSLDTIAQVTASKPHVMRLQRVMHLATDVYGTLTVPTSALAVAGVVHPSAAVCGTPTLQAAAAIAELEGFDRGRYAGPVGWVDAHGDGEFAIALRCGQVGPDNMSIRLFAGGGIVPGSEPNTELAETARKFLPMYEALSPVDRP